MSGANGGGGGVRILLTILVVGAAGLLVYLGLQLRDQGDSIRTLTEERDLARKTLQTKELERDSLIRDGAQLRVDLNDLEDEHGKTLRALETANAELEKARADLASVRRERDEHLGARVELEARLDAAFEEIGKAKKGD